VSSDATLAPDSATGHGIVASGLRSDIQHDLPPLASLQQEPANQRPFFSLIKLNKTVDIYER